MLKRNTQRLLPVLLMAFLVLVGVQAVCAQSAQPQLPHTFWGTTYVGESPAAQGVEVIAVGPGVISGVAGNPVKTLAGGVYGETGMSSQKLLVQGDIEPGTPVEFYVGGVKAEVNPVSTPGVWKTNYSYVPGEDTQMNLRISVQVSTSQTREPTPVQTRLPSSAVEAFLPQTSATYQPVSQPTGTQTGTKVTTSPTRASTTSVGEVTVTTSPAGAHGPAGTQGLDMFGSGGIIGIVIIVLVIIVIAGYAVMRTKNKGEADASERKEEDKEK